MKLFKSKTLLLQHHDITKAIFFLLFLKVLLQIESGATWQQQCEFCSGRHTGDVISYSLTYQGCFQPYKFLGTAYETVFSGTQSPVGMKQQVGFSL